MGDARSSLAVGGHTLSLTLHQWINDGLMAVFFLLVGLEIKREALAGELASPRQAALPIAGAIGGMLVPASIYLADQRRRRGDARVGDPHGDGHRLRARRAGARRAARAEWAQGLSRGARHRGRHGSRAGDRALLHARDRVGSPGDGRHLLVVLVALNVLRVRRLTPYLVLGLGLWFFVHESGVHATIAGVLLAFAIPTRTRINATEYSAKARRLLDDFDRTETGDLLVLTSKGQQEAIIGLERASEGVTAPLLRLEHALHGFSAFVVMPLFALFERGRESERIDRAGASRSR